MKTLRTIHSADVIALAISTPTGPRPNMDTVQNATDFANACDLTNADIWDVDGPLNIEGDNVRWEYAVTLSNVIEGSPDEQVVYLLGNYQ